jgi:2-C-methyl-D-erythritol 4-phosphate cytidylyltransferase
MIHDAARPAILPNDILDFINSVIEINKSSIMAVPIFDTIKKVDKKNNIIRTILRDEMWLAQTPQMFRFGILFESLKHCIENGIEVTDESQALEVLNHECTVIKGKSYNIKITEDIDLIHARCLANINVNLLENEGPDD